jgi:uncharacterized protein YdeI (YjbR/CyaY-like superfamily)
MASTVNSKNKSQNELPIILFEKPSDWASWLEENGAQSSGLWLRLAKKASGITSITYAEAVDVALCYGWIDGLKKSYDESSWLQKFTPRRPKSIWSKINCSKAEALIASGQMKPAGLAEVERAKQDGRWEAAYDSHSTATVPNDFEAALESSPEAKSFFATLNSTNRYAILYRIQTAKKAETRAKRIQEFVRMLEQHEVFHPPAGTSTGSKKSG